jgi:hypothetical protein
MRRGDIVQAWKGNKGHSFVVENVQYRDDGAIAGFTMLSATNGHRLTVDNTILSEQRGATGSREGFSGYTEFYVGRFYDVEE